ncbi:MAG: NAD-dependent epimerase/dehydratase family protein [Dehalococcoidia bacterium]|nr:NAD-dependent epimerase/dehydratase family protein [Dehalococcoidia bacterium]
MGRSLITGGAGMLGKELARLLLADNEDVTLLDVTPASRLPKDIRERVTLARGDLANWAQVLDAVKTARPDTIYHVAAMMPPACEIDHAAGYAVNVVGTFNVLEAARLFDVGTVVYSSTTATFGSVLPDVVPNDYVQRPPTMYGTSKVCSEQLGQHYHRHYGLDFRAVRFLSILGPGRVRGSGWSAYTSLMMEETARGRPFVIPVADSLSLRFLYVKDAALALVQLARADADALTTRVYSLDGFSASTQELVDATRKYVPGAQISSQFDPEYQRVMETQYVCIQKQPDDSAARADWDWQPHYTLDEAVRDLVEDIRSSLE